MATTVSMVGRSNLFFRAIAYTLDSNGQGLPDWWQLQFFSTLGTDPYADPDGDGWTNIEEYGNGTDPHHFDTPPPPKEVSAVVNGTNIIVKWLGGGGPVDHYTVEDASQNVIAEVGSNIVTYLDATQYYTWFGAPDSAVYYVRAHFTNGSSSLSSPFSTGNLSLGREMSIVRGQGGLPYLMLNSPPAEFSYLEVYWVNVYDLTYTSTNLFASIFTNGVAPIETNFLLFPYFPFARVFSTNGSSGPVMPLDSYTLGDSITQPVYGFVDSGRHLKENLKFLLRSATRTRPFSYASQLRAFNILPNPPDYYPGMSEGLLGTPYAVFSRPPSSTNYEYYGHRVYDYALGRSDFLEMRPVQENHLWLNFLWKSQNFAGSSFLTGANYDAADKYRQLISPNSLYLGNGSLPLPMPLTNSSPSWLYYRWFVAPPGFDAAEALDIGVDLATSTNHVLLSNVKNCYGLALESLRVGTNSYFPGDTIPTTAATYFPNFAIPSLQTVGYYFAGEGQALFPGTPDFSVSNSSPLIVCNVGSLITLAGWAKQAIVNGYSNKFAYLEQYFDKAYKIATNGTVTTNQTGMLSPYGEFFPTEPGRTALVTMPDIDTGERGTGFVHVISLNVDANHDGVMDFSFAGPDSVSSSRPFRFWVNDDDDSGETFGTDISETRASLNNGPANWQGNGLGLRVDGVRDLVDFFPLYLNIRSLVAALPPTNSVEYKLKQVDGAVNIVYTSLQPESFRNYLTNTVVARSLEHADAFWVRSNGLTLKPEFLNGIANSNQGILLVEGRKPSIQPLVLEVWQGTNLVAQASVSLSLSRVEDMFRQKNLIRAMNPTSSIGFPDRLTQADVPNEPETGTQNFVFIHGYNVNPTAARGAFSETFKRMYWAGSHARFYGVTWEGSKTQSDLIPGLTANYHTNVYSAFQSASNLAVFLEGLTNGPTTVVAHSLGNMLTLSAINDWDARIANFFMMDAAVAIETIQGDADRISGMIPSSWAPYTNRLYSHEWFNLFPTNDSRHRLTWQDRLANFRNTEVYNFYSDGEEVLRSYTNDPPINLLSALPETIAGAIGGAKGSYVWVWQEKLKGAAAFDNFLGSTHGGWKFNFSYNTNSEPEGLLSPALAAGLPNAQLQTNAFFDFNNTSQTHPDAALRGTGGSQYAQAQRDRILADAIPALTLPIGANLVDVLGATHNFNMPALYKNGWPLNRQADESSWHHSDFREVGFTFIWGLYNRFVQLGNLQ